MATPSARLLTFESFRQLVLALRFFNLRRCFEDIAAGLALVSYGGLRRRSRSRCCLAPR